MFLVGLTGGIASGKSSVSLMFKSLNCEVIDADEIARQVVEPGQPTWKETIRQFGKEILLPTGEINRDKLGDVIFSDPGKRRLLNSITHPAIHKVMLWKIVKLFVQGQRFVILDIPLLFEAGVIAPFMRKIVVVYCNPEAQLARLIERNGYTLAHAQERIDAQMALNEKCHWATHVVDNSGTEKETFEQVLKIYKEFEASRAYLYVRALIVILLGGVVAFGYILTRMIW